MSLALHACYWESLFQLSAEPSVGPDQWQPSDFGVGGHYSITLVLMILEPHLEVLWADSRLCTHGLLLVGWKDQMGCWGLNQVDCLQGKCFTHHSIVLVF